MITVMKYMRRLSGFDRNAKLFLISTLLNGLGISLFVLLYNLYILSLGFHEDMIGGLTALASLVAVIAAIPAGWLANRIGYKAAAFLGIVGSAVSVVGPLLWTSVEGFIFCELLWGSAFTMFVIVGSPFITDNSSEEDRPYLFSLQIVLTTLTTFVGCLFGGELPRLFGGWLGVGPETPVAYQAALWLGTGLLFVSAAPMLFVRMSRRQRAHAARPRFAVRKPGKVARLVIPGIIGALGGGMFVPFVNVIWKVSHGLDDAAIGQVLAVSGLVMSVTGVLVPILSRRLGLARINIISSLLAGIAVLVFGFTPFLAVALIGFLSRDALANLGRPTTQQFQMERTAADERAAVSSVYTMGVNIAWGMGSWASGMWQTQGSFALVFVLSAVCSLASAGLWYVLHGRTAERDAIVQDDEALTIPVAAASPAE